MQHKTTDKPVTQKGILTSTFGWQLSLFVPTCDLKKSQVSHEPVKSHELKCLTAKTKHFIMPICMDRVDGQQLYSPENFAKLIAMMQKKFPGYKFDIEVVLTGELNGYNIQRKNHINDIALSIEDARTEGRVEAEKYLKEITPYIEQLQKSGHRFTVKHWSEYTSISKIQDIYKHLLDSYETNDDYAICIDTVLCRFYTRQIELGQRAPAKKANAYNIQYILEESAFLIYVYAYLRNQFDHLIYENDHLSPQISEAACQVARGFLQKDGVELKPTGQFYLEFQLQKLNQDAAQRKQEMLESQALLERMNALHKEDPVNSEVVEYHSASKKVNVLLTGSYGDAAYMFKKMFGDAGYLGVDTSFKPQGTYPEYRCYLFPKVGLRLNVLDSLPSTICALDAEEFYVKTSMEYGIIMHHFEVNNEAHVAKSLQLYDKRKKQASHAKQKQCLVAHFNDSSINLNTFSVFEKIRKSAPAYISETLYHGIFSNDLKRIEAKLADLDREEPCQYIEVELMDTDQKQRQLAKFMQKLV